MDCIQHTNPRSKRPTRSPSIDTQPDLKYSRLPPLLPPLLHTVTRIPLLSLQSVIDAPLLSQKRQLSALVQYLRAGMMVVPRRSAPTMRGKSQLQYFLILSLLSVLSVHFSHWFALSCTTYVPISNSTHGCINSGLCHFCHRSLQSVIL